ncbi:hypothetical protein WICPIJ_009408 [Wickerhamomyces pijperi]|uniref:Septin-type G domain-containing protein n=1 Tax=Wickerhamomyces pijperi TaxID=599730 RepID=A0A9P8PMP6_WICPI|nr:hypothetical protein WICPIJ_009408 [Wickerhamomyces pijperi]
MDSSTIRSPEEIRRLKIFKKGIDFTILIVGEEGLGKSSFINSLCQKQVLLKETENVNPSNSHLNPGLKIDKIHVNIVEENSTPISLDLILTPGFGDNIDNSFVTNRIVEYLEAQFDAVLSEEYKIQRNSHFKDGRPHVCLYFIRPTSKGLRELDIQIMKELSTRVNVIPVISKADSLTSEELILNKALILQDIKSNNIKVYDFAVDETDFETIDEFNFLKQNLPFAVSGSYEKKTINGNVCHVREYPWGTFKVEDVEHNDFTHLRNVLFGSHLQELKESTGSKIYEFYRRSKLVNGIPTSPIVKTRLNDYESTINSKLSLTHPAKPEAEEYVDPVEELLRKKMMIESYANEIKMLEAKIRQASLS